MLITSSLEAPSNTMAQDRDTAPSSKAAISTHPVDSSMVLYGDDTEQRNSKFQLAWTNIMENGCYSNSPGYNDAHVLLLSWDEDDDDLGVRKEVDELAAVFKNKFRYHCHIERLRRHPKKMAQAYVNKVVADWVWEYDGPRTLLIVYFAGHGRKGGDDNSELHLAGRTQPRDYRAHLDRVIWNRTEENLRNTQGDVLEIFDCCYAGNLSSPRERGDGDDDPRAFEYLAAAPFNKRTPGPGETSFTSALIWSLNELVGNGKGRFTTNDLLNAIKRDAPNFERDQTPVLSKRDNTGGQLIILAPLTVDKDHRDKNMGAQHEHGMRLDISEQTVLNLQFVFNHDPSVEDIEKLGNSFNIMSSDPALNLNLNRIVWGGLHSRTRGSVLAAASRFRALIRRPLGSPSPIPSADFKHKANGEDLHEQNPPLAAGENEEESASKRQRQS